MKKENKIVPISNYYFKTLVRCLKENKLYNTETKKNILYIRKEVYATAIYPHCLLSHIIGDYCYDINNCYLSSIKEQFINDLMLLIKENKRKKIKVSESDIWVRINLNHVLSYLQNGLDIIPNHVDLQLYYFYGKK